RSAKRKPPRPPKFLADLGYPRARARNQPKRPQELTAQTVRIWPAEHRSQPDQTTAQDPPAQAVPGSAPRVLSEENPARKLAIGTSIQTEFSPRQPGRLARAAAE